MRPCPASCNDGQVERTATPDEVDDGCELGIAFDRCEVCGGTGGVDWNAADLERARRAEMAPRIDAAARPIEQALTNALGMPEHYRVEFDRSERP